MLLDLEIWIDRREHEFMHKPHTKEISLLSCLTPHSDYSTEAWKGMVHGLLSKHWRHFCREEDYVAEARQLHRGMVNRGNCPESLKQLFSEVSSRLNREKEAIGSNRVSKLQLDLRQRDETKYMKKIALLHQECHP